MKIQYVLPTALLAFCLIPYQGVHSLNQGSPPEYKITRKRDAPLPANLLDANKNQRKYQQQVQLTNEEELFLRYLEAEISTSYSYAPTVAPTMSPTHTPTKAPTEAPTKASTEAPTKSPITEPTKSPITEPTKSPTQSPITAPTKAPTKAPAESPTMIPSRVPPTRAPFPTESCKDSDETFVLAAKTNGGVAKTKACEWVKRNNTAKRCDIDGVKSHCPNTCGACTRVPTESPNVVTRAPFASGSCKDSDETFVLARGGVAKTKACEWVRRNNTAKRCDFDGVKYHCPNTCGACTRVPTESPNMDPTKVSPTRAPSASESCKDSDETFVLARGGVAKTKACEWVRRNNTAKRCDFDGVKSHCPNTCGACTRVPTESPNMVPTKVSPTRAPSAIGSCEDSGVKFLIETGPARKVKTRSCDWVGNNNTAKRCDFDGVKSHCPNTCDACATYQCADSEMAFVKWGKNDKRKTCIWVGRKPSKLARRCDIDGVASTCRDSCSYAGNGFSC